MARKKKEKSRPATETALPAVLDPPSEVLEETPAVSGGDTLRHYLRQVTRYPRLTREEEQELATRYREYGDTEAAYRLVTGNLRLVVHIAFEYRRTFLNLLDLVQEGNIGLMQAAKKFDPLRGVPFSSYAAWWIRAYMLKHLLDHWSIVKVGTTNARRRLFFNLKKEKERLELQGISPGPRLLAETFDSTEQDVVDVSRALEAKDLSLDAPLTSESEHQVWETIPAPEAPPDEKVAQAELKEILRDKVEAFSRGLKEKERYVLTERLVAEEPATLQAVGDHFGITREAVRLIEKKVIAKLREYLKAEIDDLSVYEVADDPDHRPESPAALARRPRS